MDTLKKRTSVLTITFLWDIVTKCQCNVHKYTWMAPPKSFKRVGINKKTQNENSQEKFRSLLITFWVVLQSMMFLFTTAISGLFLINVLSTKCNPYAVLPISIYARVLTLSFFASTPNKCSHLRCSIKKLFLKFLQY